MVHTDRVVTRQRPKASLPLVFLAILAALYSAHFTASLLIPIMLALFLTALFFSVVTAGSRAGIPPALTAALCVGALGLWVFLVVSLFSEPAREWLKEAPSSLREAQALVQGPSALDDLRAVADEVSNITEPDSERTRETKTTAVVVKEPGWYESLVIALPNFTAQALVIVTLTFFLLVTGDTWLRKIVQCGRTWGQRRRLLRIAKHMRREISRYLATVTLVNASLGAVVAVALEIAGVPNAAMWGVVAALLNFAPYIGAVVVATLLAVVGFGHFDNPAQALMLPLGYLTLTTLEGQVITPAILGARLSISSAVVLLSVIFGAWIWGVAGALMAVPMLVSFKAFCDHYPPLNFVGYMLGNGLRSRESLLGRSRINYARDQRRASLRAGS